MYHSSMLASGPLGLGSLPYKVIRLYLKEAGHHVLVYLHDDSHVVEVAIVCCGKDCHEFSTGKELVTIFLDLMSAANQVEIIFLIEIFNNDFTKSVGDTTIILSPVDYVFLRVGGIRPQQVTKKS